MTTEKTNSLGWAELISYLNMVRDGEVLSIGEVNVSASADEITLQLFLGRSLVSVSFDKNNVSKLSNELNEWLEESAQKAARDL